MTVKSFIHPVRGQLFFGRRRPRVAAPRARLSHFIRKSLPSPPAMCDYTSTAMTELRNVYLNDREGDCVIAFMAHGEAVITANNPSLMVSSYTDDQINQVYSAVGGYVPGDPSTDDGCDIETALNYWTTTGMPDGRKIAGSLDVDPSDSEEYRTAIWLFEVLCAGIDLPDAWLQSVRDGSTWDVAGDPDPDNGHCVGSSKYGLDTIWYTWGDLVGITDAAIAKYCAASAGGELHAVISQDTVNRATQRAPSGFDWAGLVSYFNAMGGNLTLPS